MVPHIQHAAAIRTWLLSLMVLVACMIFIGGVTRLTESGLSIVEWKLFSGIFPPLSQEGWESEFAEYKSSPEFIIKNSDFGISEFKQIFWLEYIHRLLGRIIGLAFLVPFAYFLVRKALPLPLIKRMAIATLLVGLQGTVGWIMVASGLVDAPRVNPLKLALHLSLAFTLFGLLLWTYWQVTARTRTVAYSNGFYTLVTVTIVALVIQIILGALVAGNDAGLSYNSYPLMDGHFIPPNLTQAITASHPWYSDTLIVQFIHRTGAHIFVILTCILVWFGLSHSMQSTRNAVVWVGAGVGLQFILGVLTLLYVVPISLASAHQMAALLLLGLILNLRFLAAKPQVK